jgi:Leucine-rich repeat (LRR) protein
MENNLDHEMRGPVGFFDAPHFSPFITRAAQKMPGVVGFYDALDESAEEVLCLRVHAYCHDGSSENADANFSPFFLTSLLFQNTASISKLIVRHSGIRMSDLNVLSGALIQLHQLRVLDFSFNPLNCAGVAMLLDGIRGNVNLTELRLAGVEIVIKNVCDSVPLLLPFEYFSRLEVLDLSYNDIRDEESIRSIGLAASNHAKLSCLNLQGNCISAEVALLLCSYARRNVMLHSLILGKHADPPRKIRDFLRFKSNKSNVFELIGSNFSLHTFVLDDNCEGVEHILMQNREFWNVRKGLTAKVELMKRELRYLPSLLFELVHITHLDLSENQLESVPEEILCLVALKWLSFAKNKIDVQAIPVHLSHLKALEYLSVAGNPFCEYVPKDVDLNACHLLCTWFSQFAMINDLETQVGICITSLGENSADKLASKLDKTQIGHLCVRLADYKQIIAGDFLKLTKKGRRNKSFRSPQRVQSASLLPLAGSDARSSDKALKSSANSVARGKVLFSFSVVR